MVTKGNEFFYRVKGLMVPKKHVDDSIIRSINRYIDIVQTLSEKLKSNLNNNRIEHFISNMEIAVSVLRSVYARWLETEAEAILRAAKNDRIDFCKKSLSAFITSLLTLSIEMQKAQNAGDILEEIGSNEIETHEEMANNLSAVSKLIKVGEYESARGMLTDMEELGTGGAFAMLIELVAAKNYSEAGDLANVLKENHMKFIKDVNTSGSNSMKKILAVDDRPEILNTVNNALRGHYKVFGLTGGKAAINFLKAQKPDLFILDIEMPELNGYELAEIIRATTSCAKTPIVFLTSNSTRDHVMKALASGGNDFIVKPTSHEALLAKVHKYLM